MSEQPTSDERFRPLEQWEMEQLATYNSEVARGLVHREDWSRRMAYFQERFNATYGRHA